MTPTQPASEQTTGSPPQEAGAIAGRPPVSVVILTHNEEANVADCLRSCAWSDDVHVLDSGSTDRTCEIARECGATVHVNPFVSFGVQRNWAIDNIHHKHDWVFHLDADERFTPALVNEIDRLLAGRPHNAGFYVPQKLIFMGRWLKRSIGYPVYQMRLFHKDRMRFRDYGHGQRENTSGPIGRLKEPYLHYNFSKGMFAWIERHNRYSTLEAKTIVAGDEGGGAIVRGSLFGGSLQRRRFFKARIYPKMPGKWMWRFLYMYFFMGGFLDGMPGFHYSMLMSSYELFTSLKVRELRQTDRDSGEWKPQASAVDSASRFSTGDNAREHEGRDHEVRPGHESNGDSAAASASADDGDLLARSVSPWSLHEKIGRVLWMLANSLLFRPSFHNWYAWRRWLLRCFGAKIGDNVRVRPTCRVEIPWNLEIGDNAAVGDHAILYSLGSIRIGRFAVVSQYAHLCAGTHDYTDPSFPLIRPPITIGDEAWIAADAFVGPGVTVGRRAVVGARATVVRDVPPDHIVVGNPARCIKRRDASAGDPGKPESNLAPGAAGPDTDGR
ncbi:MAG: Colanic acid biosynthesis acetyltransferase WcaF [Phycisphaerales bacterium]|nr:Colanic acid biosynthesis acetyltransferase WcaF [Phycisphaerales bacterium]